MSTAAVASSLDGLRDAATPSRSAVRRETVPDRSHGLGSGGGVSDDSDGYQDGFLARAGSSGQHARPDVAAAG